MLKKLLLLPLIALSFATVQTLAYADSTKPASHPCPCKKMDAMAKQLQLDDAQVAKIKDIKAQNQTTMKANREQMRQLRMQINALVFSTKLDEAKLDDLIAQKTKLHASMQKARFLTKNKIFNLLNPTQQAQFQKIVQKGDFKKDEKKCICKTKA